MTIKVVDMIELFNERPNLKKEPKMASLVLTFLLKTNGNLKTWQLLCYSEKKASRKKSSSFFYVVYTKAKHQTEIKLKKIITTD